VLPVAATAVFASLLTAALVAWLLALIPAVRLAA
jgi:hypothetical protein